MAELPVGTKLDHYEIRAPLGAGGMGEVYRAFDSKLRRDVAIKILPAAFSADAVRLRRFEQEAQAAAALNHPHIAQIYEIGEVEGTHFIAMEYIDGSTLREKIYREETPLPTLLEYLNQVADGLAKAHASGIVHRDLKPDNIMITLDGYAKILDFGLAKLVEPQRSGAGGQGLSELATSLTLQHSPHSLQGTALGTIGYMSPEQAQGRVNEVDHRSDIFAFGCTLYEAVAGQRAFEGQDALESLYKIVYGPTPQVGDVKPLAHDELQGIISRCLAKDATERYQSIKEVALKLEEVRHDLRGVVSTSSRSVPQVSLSSAEYVVNEIKRHKTAVLVVLPLVAAAAIVLGWYVRAGGSKAAINSVAVLPFMNTAGDLDAEYLSDGISESLVSSLSQLPGVKVIASSSSLKYKGKQVDPREVGSALSVEAIVTGRVTEHGDHLIVSVELVNAHDRTQVWGEQYSRKAEDVLVVQAEISREIAEKLRSRLSVGERQQLAKRQTVNPQAYELLLKGLYFRRQGGTVNGMKAVEYYREAAHVDPAYALAYAELAVAYCDMSDSSLLDPMEFTPKAEAAAQKALKMDETLADAHYALALVKRDAWEWATARREYQRAIELNPNLAAAHLRYAFFLNLVGQHERAIAEIKRARELDPLSSAINANVGYVLYLARQYDQASDTLQKTIELDRNFPPAHAVLGFTYAAQGRHAEAIAAFNEAINLGNKSPSLQIHLGAAYSKVGEHEKAQAILKRLRESDRYVSPGELALLHAALGNREEAFASLERAYAAHDPELQYLGAEPAFDSLRADPRFTGLLRRVGL